MDNSKQPAPVLDDQDESVRIAVKALGDMRNSAGRKDRKLRAFLVLSLFESQLSFLVFNV